jgi:ribonuclease P protein component
MRLYRYPRAARLARSRDYERARREGKRIVAPPLALLAVPRRQGLSRLGLAVGRRIGKAVVRNRWKRAIREAFRLNHRRLRRPYDIVVSVWRTAPVTEVRRVEAAFLQAVEELNASDAPPGDGCPGS